MASSHVSWSSQLMSEGMAAKWWNIDLERWYEISKEARIAMIAIYRVSQALDSGESNEQMQEAERKAKK